jgi:hypothetical protein
MIARSGLYTENSLVSYNDKTSAVCYYCVNNNNYLNWSRQPAQGMYASWNEVRPATKEL